MSTHKVEVVAIDEVVPHPNADRLDLVVVKGWNVVTGKGNFKAGDLCVYFPIDSVLPADLEAKLFPPDSKIKLSKSRIKTAKIRGAVSQGMVVKPEVVGMAHMSTGIDVAPMLGVTKYEPPAPKQPAGLRSKKPVHRRNNPYFQKYTDLENVKNFKSVFADGETVVVTEKIHGTNFRAGWVPWVATSLWGRLKQKLGLAPRWEFVYGSRNIQLQNKLFAKTFYPTNVYEEAVKEYGLYTRLHKGVVVYGEIYGDGIQKGYAYGCKPGEHKLVLFDVQQDGVYMPHSEARAYCATQGLPMVPMLGVIEYSFDRVKALAAGDSVLAPTQKVREGVVLRPIKEDVAACGRKILKVINDDYLLGKHADEEVAHDQVAA